MAGLWIAHANLQDPDTYAEYSKAAGEVVAAHDGVFLARGGNYRQLEGKEFARNVVIRFPTFARALECYESDGYQAIVDKATGAAERSIVIVDIDD
jgi:uncharacterized protein (DUF1330 family)